MRASSIVDGLNLKGRVEIFVARGAPTLVKGNLIRLKPAPLYASTALDFSKCSILDVQRYENIIVNNGKDKVIQSLTTGFLNTVARMAVGDRGTIPSDPTQPKVPQATRTTLFHEVYRDDLDATSLHIADPDNPNTHEVTFTKTFSATLIPASAFFITDKPVINEVGVIMCDLLAGQPLPRPPVANPGTPLADESLFAMRAFKSVPFEAANEVTVTIRYTIYIE